MKIGPNDLKNIQLPPGIDPVELQRLDMLEGRTYEQVLTDINDALDMADANVYDNPLLTSLVSTTTRPDVEYRVGNTGGFEDHTEYGEGDEQRAETGGHMLPIKTQDKKLGWSADYLRDARLFQLDADIASAGTDYDDAIQQRVITRLFKVEAETGKSNGLGANGISVPFCDGGACGVSYVPPTVSDRGGSFDASHTHYLRLDGINQANVEAVVEHLWEHKHDGPYDLLVSGADVADWTDKTAVTGFKERGVGNLVTYGSNESLANVEDIYLGLITTRRGPVRLMANGRIESGFWNMRKSYGSMDARNPLRIRLDPKFGRAPQFQVPVAKLIRVQNAIIVYRMGVGIGEDRTSAVSVLNAANGAYRTPVIS